MTRPVDVLRFIQIVEQVLANFDRVTGWNGAEFRQAIKSVKDPARRQSWKAERKLAFKGNTPDYGKYFMAAFAGVCGGTQHLPASWRRLPNDFFSAEGLCAGELVDLVVVPDLERPGRNKVMAAVGTVEAPADHPDVLEVNGEVVA